MRMATSGVASRTALHAQRPIAQSNRDIAFNVRWLTAKVCGGLLVQSQIQTSAPVTEQRDHAVLEPNSLNFLPIATSYREVCALGTGQDVVDELVLDPLRPQVYQLPVRQVREE